jgi:hypothetical protein
MVAIKHTSDHGGGGGFVAAQEIFQLTRLLRENRDRYYSNVNVIVPYHGEFAQKSFREWSWKNILLWQKQSKGDPFASVEIKDVARSLTDSLAYQVDFSISSRRITEYYVMRITQVSPDTFTLTIQRKNSPASIPIGLDRAPVVWSQVGKPGGL